MTISQDDINDLTADEGLRKYLAAHIPKQEAEEEAVQIVKPAKVNKPVNGKAKHKFLGGKIKVPKTSLSVMGGSAKVDYTKFEHASEETVNLHVSGILPASDKLRFIDPQAVALPHKAIPRVKVVLDAMSKSVKKSNLPYITIAIAAVIAIIGLAVVYDRIIEPAQEAERAYNLEVMKRGGNTTGLEKPDSLFKFEPINPFAGAPR